MGIQVTHNQCHFPSPFGLRFSHVTKSPDLFPLLETSLLILHLLSFINFVNQDQLFGAHLFRIPIMMQPEEKLDNPNGKAFTWIQDHCLRYPGTYEIPLRTMYSLNCNSMRQQGAHPPETSFTSQSSHSSKSSQSSHDFQLDQAADFKAQLSNQIARLPSQPCSLPPSFITTFLRRCFAPQFEDVDFHQALTALDYLRDLETRQRREFTAALQRLNLNPEDLKDTDLEKKYPGLSTWIESMKTKTNKVESLYSHVYIGLRRWVSACCHQSCFITFKAANTPPDSDQRDVGRTIQQGKLYRNAQHPLPSRH